MASTFSLVFTAGDGETPVNSAKRSTALKLRNWFNKRGGGNSRGADTVACKTAQVYGSGSITCATVVNANTVTLNGTALTATQAYARGTVTPTTSGIDVADTLTVQGVVLTARKHNSTGTVTITAAGVDNGDVVVINGASFTAAAAENLATGAFNVSGTDTAAATSLAACINASVSVLIAGLVTATSSAGVVTVRKVATGTGVYTLTSDDAQLAVSGAGTLTAGTVPAADEFDISGSNAQTCTSIAAAINANATLAALVTAWTSATVVTIRAILPGTAGNAYTLSSDDAQIAVSDTTLAGGAAIANNQFDFGGSDTETAAALAAAINASTTALVNKHVTATSSGAVVTLTAVIPGHAGNAVTTATSGSTLAITGSLARLAGGTETLTTHTY